MNPMRIFCLAACLLAATISATPTAENMKGRRSNSLSNNLKPTDWLSTSELDNLPAVDEITLRQLESMSVDEGARLVNKLYHLAQISEDIQPSHVPNAQDIPAFIAQPNGQRVMFPLNELVQNAKQQNFGNKELTIFITGLPDNEQNDQQLNAVNKANKKLERAYMKRYNGQQTQSEKSRQNKDYVDNKDKDSSSSEEASGESWKSNNGNSGNLLVIQLGNAVPSFKKLVMLDTKATGSMIAKYLVDLTNEVDVPEESINLVGQGIGAHVAGETGRVYTRRTGHKLRRITGLDPSKIFTKPENTLTGLARGDADFVDAIHTAAYSMGTPARVADIDFYPNGPSDAVPGSDNIIEASMRATRYFAETVRPGNERNFPAVAANSLQQYKSHNGYGQRAYMGIATDFDLKGDYILQVNSKAPFGKSAPAQKQRSYHEAHQSWKNMNNQDYE